MKYQKVRVGDLIQVQRRVSKFTTGEYNGTGLLPIIDQGSTFVAGYSNDVDRAYDGDLPVIVFGDHTCSLKYVDFKFGIGADGTQLLRPGSGVDTRYLYYALHTADLEQHGYQRHFKLLKECSIATPPLGTQRRIAAILGAYDDLIEVNRRRATILENMARGLFEEWFVRFRYPGHEDAPMVDAQRGVLPTGWVSTPIDDAFSMTGGGTPSKAVSEYWKDGSINWYTPSDLTKSKSVFLDASEARITPEGLGRSSATRFPPECVMMTSRATLGVIAINSTEASTNQGFITCIPNEKVPRTFLYHWLGQNVPVFISHATGATFKEITKGVFKRLSIVIPPHALTAKYEAIAGPFLNMVRTLERSNRTLAAARDLLLPRLISGQLSVTAAERELQEAA